MIKNVVIWGCRDGKHLLEEIKLKALNKYNVVAFGDNGEKYRDSYIDEVPVWSANKITDEYINNSVDIVIIAVRKGYSRFCIINQLKEKGISNILLVKPAVLTYNLPIVFDENHKLYRKQWLDINTCDKPIIHHLEINIADGCNLNCRGCLHFSNLYSPNDFPDPDELLKTIEEITKHCEIFQFRVLGGEPLLFKELPEFLEKLRKILPDTDLAVISNGILIPKYNKKLYAIMNENYIGINLTLYEPTLKMKDMIYATLDESYVAYGSHESKCEKFEKFLKLSSGSTKAFETCEPRGILVVKEDMLYRCPIEAYIDRFYKEYNIELKAPDGINIYDADIDWKKLIDSLYTESRPLCTYCSEQSEFYEWGNGKPEMGDWIVKEK